MAVTTIMISRSRLLNFADSLKQFNRYIRIFGSKSETTVPDARPVVDEPIVNSFAHLTENENQKKLIPKRILPFSHPLIDHRQAWVENMNTLEPNFRGIIDLHFSVFGVRPRVDAIFENYKWQMIYKSVNRNSTPWQHEIKRSTKRPWPTRTGRARHGTRRSPIFKGGVKLFGPRGPLTHFYMLPQQFRVLGLCSMLSVKYAQDDLHIVDSLEIPTSDSSYIEELVESRRWGPSVLIVDINDIMPKNIALACHEIKHINLMPVYGLNVQSMLKHDTLVLTIDALQRIEERLLFFQNTSHLKENKLLSRPEVKGLDYYDYE